MAQRAIMEAVGIAEQFRATWLLVDNDRAGSDSERMEDLGFRTTFAVQRILRNDIITSRPCRAAGMGVPNDAANRSSVMRHGCSGPMRCDVFICMTSDF